ncbi:MAG: hypothetical protein QOH16_2965 [Gaiellaceae bacterium]|nr:hypothetical protein [Gaiellaceae bacterium]
MRRERNILLAIALFAVAAFFSVAPAALADGGSPADICRDAQDGTLNGTYTADQIATFLQDPTVQGYCGPITIVVPPAPKCVELPAGTTPTPGVTYCQPTPPTTPPVTPPTTPPVTPPATPPATPPSTPPAGGQAPATVSAVKGASHTTVSRTVVTTKVKGAQHTVKTPVQAAGVAPLGATKTSGTLPFTGADLGLFALVGLALLGIGVLLRSTGRASQRR